MAPECLDHWATWAGQSVLAHTYKLEDFVAATFCCQNALAVSNRCIPIREKTLKFSWAMLPIPFTIYRGQCKTQTTGHFESNWCNYILDCNFIKWL